MSEQPGDRPVRSPYVVENEARDAPDADPESDPEPKPAQGDIIASGAYPLRVLAGAGTGKTFTMVRKIEALLDAEGPGETVLPDDVLALTFTNKAADSIREKLADRLDARAFDVDAYTYHSIAYRILRNHTYEAEVDPDFDIAGEPDQYAIVYEVLDEVEYQFISPPAYPLSGASKGVEKRLFEFITECKQKGITATELRPNDGYLPTAETLFELSKMVDNLQAVANKALGDLTRKRSIQPEYFETLVSGLEAVKETAADAMERVEQLAERPAPEAPRVTGGGTASRRHAAADFGRHLTSLQSFAASYRSMLLENRDTLVGSGAVAVQKYPLYVLGVLGSDNSLPDDLDVVRALGSPGGSDRGELDRFLDSCQTAYDLSKGYEAYEDRLDRYGLLDIQDLILKATDLLADKTVATDWTYVFCDEFQDTDPIQFELVRELVGDGNLFVVGDDDQAVYEWRGANVENIRSDLTEAYGAAAEAPIASLRAAARADGTDQGDIDRTRNLGEDHDGVTDLPLEQNFRSLQPILDLANEAIGELDGRGSEKELRAVGDASDATDGVYHIVADDGTEGDELSRLVNTVRRLATGNHEVARPIDQLGDIGVLVRSNSAAQDIALRFDSVGIPYEIAGGMATHSTGVETMIAVLKLLADTTDDVSLNRVLRMRYRLPESDLTRLNQSDQSALRELLLASDPSRFTDWSAVSAARDDFKELLRHRDADSLSQLYHRVKEVTQLPSFISERERDDLEYLDEVVSTFGQRSIQPELDDGFIEYLRTHAATVRDSGGVNSQPDLAEDAVNILTVHKSKGLEFQTVILPHLDSWSGGGRSDSMEQLLRTVDGDLSTALDGAARDRDEQRRTLHVAITRAEENLILSGSGVPDEGSIDDSDDQSGETARDFILAGVPDGESVFEYVRPAVDFDPWTTVHRCAPATAIDATEELGSDIGPADGVDLETLQSEPDADPDVDLMEAAPLATSWRAPFIEAAERIVRESIRMLDGELDPIDPDEYAISEPTYEREPSTDLRRHSYTSIAAHRECPRAHYLEYGVGAPTDGSWLRSEADGAGNSTDSRAVSRQAIGIVFHRTTEEVTGMCLSSAEGMAEATWPMTETDWRRVASRHAAAYRAPTDPLFEHVRACITELFRTEVTEWEPLASEYAFEKDLQLWTGGAGGVDRQTYTIHGSIDGVFARPSGDLAILDYKTGTRKPARESLQLDIYAWAAAGEFDRPIGEIGIAYVNPDIRKRLDLRPCTTTSDTDLQDSVGEDIVDAGATAYHPARPGPHCRGCDYNWLPCYAPPEEE